MVVLIMIFSITKKGNIVNIFKHNFVKKNKGKYKIIYNNKLLPLQTKLVCRDQRANKLKIQLICYNDNLNIYDLNFLFLIGLLFYILNLNQKKK